MNQNCTFEDMVRAQEVCCEMNEMPMFAPKDGVCPACGRNIYHYISRWEAGARAITSCPVCGASFCE